MLSVGRLRSRVIVLAVVIVALLSTGTWFALSHAQARQSGHLAAATGHARQAAHAQPAAPPLQVLSVTPARRARHVNGAAPVQIQFSAALAAGSPMPTVSPHVAGSWQRSGASTVEFPPKKGFPELARVAVRIPGGSSGMRSAAGGTLAKRTVVRFRVGRWSATRLDQLLAQLGYLPLTWTPAAGAVNPAASDRAGQRSAAFRPPAGTFTWRHGYPRELRTFWRKGRPSLVLKGAVMAFESDHGLAMDGIAGPGVWRTLFKAVAAGQRNPHGYTYARARKKLPEELTIWHDGHVVFRSLANTGIPVAPTADGTAPVYLRYRYQVMRGTNPDGSKYADPVQFVAYFRAGEAVHYFPRYPTAPSRAWAAWSCRSARPPRPGRTSPTAASSPSRRPDRRLAGTRCPAALASLERARKCRPRADAQLDIGAGQMVLDGPLRDEERLRDLPVRLPGRRQLSHPQLARRQRVPAPQRVPARPAAGDHQLVASPAGQHDAAAGVRDVQALAEQVAGDRASAAPAVRRRPARPARGPARAAPRNRGARPPPR